MTHLQPKSGQKAKNTEKGVGGLNTLFYGGESMTSLKWTFSAT